MPRSIEMRRDGSSRPAEREWVREVPVALEFNGLAYAVMMATPSDLEDFVRGFALTEGLARHVGEIGEIVLTETGLGHIARANIAGLGADQLTQRVRTRVAESSCGLCGIENLEALAKPLPQIPAHQPPAPAAIFSAVEQLESMQQLNQRTGAAHGAAFARRDGSILMLREDVGRHNAVDKLVGALAAGGHDIGKGFVISTARCSFEIVEKVVRAGGTCLVTVSLPTSMAAERAQTCGLSLICLARSDSYLAIGS